MTTMKGWVWVWPAWMSNHKRLNESHKYYVHLKITLYLSLCIEKIIDNWLNSGKKGGTGDAFTSSNQYLILPLSPFQVLQLCFVAQRHLGRGHYNDRVRHIQRTHRKFSFFRRANVWKMYNLKHEANVHIMETHPATLLAADSSLPRSCADMTHMKVKT